MVKKKFHIAIIVSLLCLAGMYYVYNNIPLRTQIYRSICKGNWNLLADGDTVYATGYCGIRKYVVGNEDVQLLAEN